MSRAQAANGEGTRTTGSEDRPCIRCGRQLQLRQQRYCSDRCRMRDRREAEAVRKRDLVSRLDAVVAEAKRELEKG